MTFTFNPHETLIIEPKTARHSVIFLLNLLTFDKDVFSLDLRVWVGR